MSSKLDITQALGSVSSKLEWKFNFDLINRDIFVAHTLDTISKQAGVKEQVLFINFYKFWVDFISIG